MKHLGDITKIHGCIVPITDVVIGGSPCQDLSVAGKRAGLVGARSGLFMEQIRIVKEMRYADQCSGRTGQFIRPRYMVWENVPGAFSSNKGEDFRAVLEETARVADPNAVIPRPDGGWKTSGCIMGNGWSVAWRVLDAQFWGVPQRRRRISLVADFGGHTAPEILFERKGLCWDSAEGGETGEGIAADAERSAGKTGGGNDVTSTLYAAYGTKWNGNAGAYNGDNFVLESTEYAAYPAIARSPTARNDGSPCIDRGPDVVMQLYEPKSAFEENWAEADVKNALRAEASKSSHAIVFDARDNGDGSIATYSFQRTDELKESQVASTQSARQYKSPTDLVAAVDCRNGTVVGALCARDYKGVGSQYVDEGKCIPSVRSVRRLTPLECERLQGFPDGWTNIGSWTDTAGKLHKESSDSARYKALGNSIALPPWKWVLKRLCACYERDATMASLFDGIGGFPLIWEQLNGKGTCLWASEIEEFPIAVTKFHFGEECDEKR